MNYGRNEDYQIGDWREVLRRLARARSGSGKVTSASCILSRLGILFIGRPSSLLSGRMSMKHHVDTVV